MPYDDLVKRLRASVDGRYEKCDGCPYEEDYPCCVDCLDKMHKQAADAIEELSKRVTDWIPPHDALAIIEEYGIPYWIPPEDCLPTIGEEIITLGPNGGMDCGHYKGLSDTRRDKWNWKQHTVKTVKYWLPRKSLPEPPKEEV